MLLASSGLAIPMTVIAATVPVTGIIAFRYMKEWWKDQSKFIKSQGSGYIVGQISGRTAGLAMFAAVASVQAATMGAAGLAITGGLTAAFMASVAVASLYKGDTCLRLARKAESLYRTPVGFYGRHLHLTPNILPFTDGLYEKEKTLKKHAQSFADKRFIPEDAKYSRFMAYLTSGRKIMSYAVLIALAIAANQKFNITDSFSSSETVMTETQTQSDQSENNLRNPTRSLSPQGR